MTLEIMYTTEPPENDENNYRAKMVVVETFYDVNFIIEGKHKTTLCQLELRNEEGALMHTLPIENIICIKIKD